MTNTDIITDESASAAITKCSALITGEPLYIGIVSKKNGFHHVGISNHPDWSNVPGNKEKLVGVYNVSHMSGQEAMFAVLKIGDAAKKAKAAGIGRELVNRMVDQAARQFENKELFVARRAA